MKPRRASKPAVKILYSESYKLKSKLEVLKSQVQQKKKERDMNRTAQSNPRNKFMSSTIPSMAQTQYKQEDDNKLFEALIEMRMQNMVTKLEEKGIKYHYQLIAAQESDIDRWTDIPVGYRIRIKKYVKNKQTYLSNGNYGQGNSVDEAEGIWHRDIEAIVYYRKKEQSFVALDREVDEGYNEPELKEEEQEFMIQSLINAFESTKCKSILKPVLKMESIMAYSKEKKKYRNTGKKTVHWHPAVEYQERATKAYPKEHISRYLFNNSLPVNDSVLVSKQSNDRCYEYSYCWQCLKRMNIKYNSFEDSSRSFCSVECKNSYEQLIILNVPKEKNIFKDSVIQALAKDYVMSKKLSEEPMNEVFEEFYDIDLYIR